MPHVNEVVSYDEDFVARTVSYGKAVQDLRTRRAALNLKYQELSDDKARLRMKQISTVVADDRIRDVLLEIRKVGDEIDALLEAQLSHLDSCNLRHRPY